MLIVTIAILPLEINHLPQVLAIERVSFPEPWTQEMFEREISLPISHFFVASDEGRVVGYGGYWHVYDEAHIVNLAVHPERRSQGIGRMVLASLLQRIEKQNVARVFLEVRKSNIKAQRLYESCGFKVTGLRPRYYNNLEDALLMEKTQVSIL